VNYPDASQKASNVASVDMAGDYARINLNAVATLVLNEQMSFTTNFRAQKSLRGNLDTSEQLLLTGSTGIRSFDEGYNGDSGYVVTPELSTFCRIFPALRITTMSQGCSPMLARPGSKTAPGRRYRPASLS
jgi:hemolysin activation/secretion protein